MKKALKEQALLELLNWELAAYEECTGCRFTAVNPVRLEADHPIDPAERLIARNVLSETRRVFDLA